MNILDSTKTDEFLEPIGGAATIHLVALRSEESCPSTIRFAQYPDGSKRLQGGYRYTEGHTGGIVWRDLPCVQVDDKGQEIPA